MKKSFRRTALILGIIASIIVSLIGSHFFRQWSNNVMNNVKKWQMHGLEIPKTGQWKNDELNLSLDYHTGLATLKTEQKEIRCDIRSEVNSTEFCVIVLSDPDEEHGMPYGTVILSGHYEVTEEDRVGIREYDTDIMYWFYRISETD